jgi:hypothetical protein
MALVDEATTIWKNNDGLRVRFGTDQADAAREGSPCQSGSTKKMEIDIVYSDMAAFGLNQFVNKVPTAVMPAGMLLKSAVLTVVEPFDSAGDALTLDIGTANQDGTVVDADGIDVAVAQASIDAIGETVTCDGALIGTILASDQYLTLRANVATATAGKAKLLIELLPVGDL